MTYPKTQNYLKLVIAGVFYSAAWSIQSLFLLNWDVSWLIHGSTILLKGFHYINSFYEFNPPLILYLYTPILVLNKLFTLEISSRIYVFILASLSLVLCNLFVKTIFARQYQIQKKAFLTTLFIIFFILPFGDFAQREHLLILFILPYLLLSSLRLCSKKINSSLAILSGILAGLGFALKPYFLITFILIECYKLGKAGTLNIIFKIETLSILIVFILYGFLLFFLHADYLSLVPFFISIYKSGFGFSFTQILLMFPILFCLSIIGIYLLLPSFNEYQALNGVLIIAILGFLIAYFLQATPYGYHFFPAFALSTLVMSNLIIGLLIYSNVKNILKISLITGLLLNFQVYSALTNFHYGINYKNTHKKLIAFLQEHADKKTISIISANGDDLFPAINYSNAIFTSPFCSLLGATYAFNHAKKTINPGYLQFLQKFITNLVLTRPNLLLVDVRSFKPYIKNLDFDYIRYLSSFGDFDSFWKNYHYVTTLEQKRINSSRGYKLDIYERNN